MNEKKAETIKNKLKSSSVGIAGVGGLGSNAAVALARAGIGRLVLVDFDKIEESNLDRQYYFTDQIGKIKVESLDSWYRYLENTPGSTMLVTLMGKIQLKYRPCWMMGVIWMP